MKIKKLVMSSMLAVGVLTLVSTSALAVETKSKGRVIFTDAEESDPMPYDPTDPTYPPREVESNKDGEGLGTKGALRFERVPNFDFVAIPISLNTKTVGVKDESYKATVTGEVFYAAPTVEITDGRGNAPGWKASVKTDGVFTPGTGTPINGEIEFKRSVAKSYTNDTLNAAAPVLTNMIVTDQFKPFAVAQKGNGHAKWGISFYEGTELENEAAANDGKPGKHDTVRKESNAVTLKISGGQQVTKTETYAADIVWLLEDTP